jgi:uncharacterized membrane protein YhfC
MGVSALLSIGLPAGLGVVFRRKYHAPFLPLAAGTAGFVVFALILEGGVHYAALQAEWARNTVLYVLYAVLAAGVFEESARFSIYLLIKHGLKKKGGREFGIGGALAYGLGHGGIEALLFGGLAMLNNIAVSAMINAGGIESIPASLEGGALERLAAATPYEFLLSGLERVSALGVQIALSVLVFHAVFGAKPRRRLYPLAIALHALADLPAALFQAGGGGGLLLTEALLALSSAALIAGTRAAHKQFQEQTI